MSQGVVVSHDRIKHWAILYLTAWLPKPSRTALRFQLFERQRRGMLSRGDVVMIRHPKTGSTWLRTLLTQLYHDRDGISPRRVFVADELALQKKGLPRWVISNGWYSLEHLIAEAYATNDPIIQGKKTIVLARHPGDIVVSWHRQYQKRTKAFKRELIEADVNPDGRIDWQAMDRWTFVQNPQLGLPAVIRYYNFWAKTVAERDNALIVRYEDLRHDTEATLRQVCDLLGEHFSDEAFAKAIEFGSVENMRELEKSGYFQNESLRLRDKNDPEALKVRKAKVGGFRGDLDESQAQWVQNQINQHLDPALGYHTHQPNV